MYLATVLTVLSWSLLLVESSNILAVLPVPSKSHHYMFQPIIKELAKRGHNITLISSYPLGESFDNIEEIIIKTTGNSFLDKIEFEELISLGRSPILVPPRISFWFFGKMLTEEYLSNTKIQKLIKSNDRKYDLVILEVFFAQEAFMGFSHRFQAPVVSINTQINYLFNDEFVGNPLSLSYVPHLELPFSGSMSFYERLVNSIRSFIVLFTGYNFYLPEQEEIMRKYFNYSSSENIPSLVDMLRNNISLTVVNSQIGLDYIRPLMPNIIAAGGMHIKNKTDPLPEDIQEFMNNSNDGVIYFSLGTIIPTQRMPPHYKNAFINAFKKVKQRVLWKANVDTMEGLPENVKVVKWAPQQSVLAHPKLRAFMTHGGLLSHQEAVYFGIPLIGFSLFCDQHVNVARAEFFGFGVKLPVNNLKEEDVFGAINEVINNKKYEETAKLYSKIVRDRQTSPVENAVYWIEYVIRHKGAPHLRNTVLSSLNYFQYLLIDVILFIIVVLIMAVYLISLTLRLLLCTSFGYYTKRSRKSKND